MTRGTQTAGGGFVKRVTTTRAIVLVLVMAGLLLAAAGGAGAHVKAKYKAEYRAKLIVWQNTFAIYENQFWATREQSNNLAALMATEMEDPDKRAELEAHRQYALTVYNNTKSQPATWRATIYPALKADLRKANRWFASSQDRARFKSQTLRVKDGFTAVTNANDEAIESFMWLGRNPPDLLLQAQALETGDYQLATGKKVLVDALAALKKLL
jgi:hypothetical protein